MSDVQSRVYTIICNQLGVSMHQLDPIAAFKENLGADSLAIAELLLALEQEFRLAIPTEQAERIQTVGDAVSYISRYAR